jgi:hypothetical protein
VVKQHDKATFLIPESENYRDTTTKRKEGLKSVFSKGENNTNYGVEVKKEGSSLVVKGLRERRESNLVVYLPKTMNISIESLANNEIYIDGFSSEIEAINHQGATVLANISGPIVTENSNGNITVYFYELSQLSPSSIVAENGDIEIRLPANVNANVTSKTPRGEFFTDFDLVKDNSNLRNSRRLQGLLNDGGVEIDLQNLKGDIYLIKIK